MNLATRAIVLSVLPLVVTLPIALPEAMMQRDVRAATRTAHTIQVATVAARDVDDARIDTALAFRRWSGGSKQAPGATAAGERAMQAALQRLDASSAYDALARQRAQRIHSAADRIAQQFTLVSEDLHRGRVGEASAILNGQTYYDDVTTLRNDVLAYVSAARTAQTQQFDSFSRLWNASAQLLVAAFSALVVACGIVLYRSLPAAHAMNELVEAQEISERELQRYRLLADVTRDGIVFLDRETLTIIDVNAAVSALYGYERSELVGCPFAMLKAYGEQLDGEEVRQIDMPAGLSVEREHRRADGSVFPVEMNARTASIDGRRVVVSTIRDISERRNAAKELARALRDPVTVGHSNATGHSASRRILLVEDSPLIRRVAKSQLESLGYAPATAENGLQAVAAFEREPYEVILMDMRMPEMDGLEATRAIRALERDRDGHVVIIAMTANVIDSDRTACMEAGMDDFLGKPVQLDALRVMLEGWLER